jgi:uncharacterized RDD family membrane protein YckC
MQDYLLDSEEIPQRKLYDADRGKRFLNFIIDYVLYLISFYAIMFIAGVFLGIAGTYDEEVVDELTIVIGIFGLAWIVVFYWLFEWLLKGRTPAKYITQTRAVNMDGSFLTSGQALGRSLGRLIPFDRFSYLFGERGFHDMVGKTRVVDWPREWN